MNPKLLDNTYSFTHRHGDYMLCMPHGDNIVVEVLNKKTEHTCTIAHRVNRWCVSSVTEDTWSEFESFAMALYHATGLHAKDNPYKPFDLL